MKTWWVVFLIFLCAMPPAVGEASSLDAGIPHRPKFRVAVMDDPPYTMKSEDHTWTGFNVNVWTQVALQRNWDYEFVEMSLEEIVRALQQETIDLTVIGLFQTPEREKLFEFSTPLGTSRLALATLPHKIEHPLLSALRIFISWSTLKVVGVLLFLLFLAGFVFWLIERERNPEHFGGGFIKGVGSGIYWVGSTLASGVCFGIDLKSLPGRLAGLFWMFVCAIVLSAFIASLTSSLTLTRLSSSSIDLKTLKTMRIGTIRGSLEATLLKRIDVKRTLFAEKREVFEALINKHIDGFLFDEATLNYEAPRVHQQALSVYPIRTRPYPFAFSMPMGSPFRKEINISLLSLMNEPYWEFLAEHYGLSESLNEQPRLGRRLSQ
jgi:polar amino acid transport system substrate-binding protein